MMTYYLKNNQKKCNLSFVLIFKMYIFFKIHCPTIFLNNDVLKTLNAIKTFIVKKYNQFISILNVSKSFIN